MLMVILPILHIVFLSFLCYLARLLIWHPGNGPIQFPIIGHAADLFLLRGNLAQLLDRLYYRTPRSSLRNFRFGLNKAYLVCEPQLAREVLTCKKLAFDVFGRPDARLDPLLAHASMFTGKDEWTHVTFDKDRLKTVAHRMKSMEVELDQLLQHLIMEDGCKNTGCDVDLKKLLPSYAAEVMVRFGFGVSVYDLQALGIGSVAERIGEIFQPDMRTAFRQTYGRYCPKLAKSVRSIYNLGMMSTLMQLKFMGAVEGFWQEKDRLHPDCLLNWMAKDAKSIGRQIGTDTVALQVFNFFLEIYLTLVVLGGHVLFNLSKHPRAHEHLRYEIYHKCGVNAVNYETLRDVAYLDAVIKETLRLYPPIGAIERICRDRVTLRGSDGVRVTLNPGELLFIPVLSINRDSKFWLEPTTFIPHRFLDDSDEAVLKKNQDLMPFPPLDNSATADFNMMALKILITTFVQNYELAPPIIPRSPSRPSGKTMITCTEQGAWIKITKRHVKKE